MLVLSVMLLQSTAAMTLRPIAAHNRCTIFMSGHPDWPPGVPPQRGGLRGAAARQAAREARIAAQNTAPPEVPSTDDSTSSDSTLSDEGVEVSAGSSSAKEDEELQVAQSPDEAKKRLQRMGATVIFPSSAGSARHPDASWSSLAGAGALREQVEEALVLPLRHPELFAPFAQAHARRARSARQRCFFTAHRARARRVRRALPRRRQDCPSCTRRLRR